MFDLHCHFLPGIDDGARDLDEALALARATVDNGVECAIMTPHLHPGRWENFAADVERHAEAFRAALAEAGIPLRIGCAAEVRLSPEIPMLIDRGQVPFLGEMDGYRLMLLEFPHGHIPPGADNLVRRLLQMRVRPIIAHPERNKDVMRDPVKIAPFADMGCILQLTAASVCGLFGERAHRTAQTLLRGDAEMILATDAHNCGARPPVLREGVVAAAGIVGEERARAMARDLPARIVDSQFNPRARATPVAEAPPPEPAEPHSRTAPAAEAKLEDLLVQLIDQRVGELLGRRREVSGDGEMARAYHRKLLRRLGGEIYRRVRREVLVELARDGQSAPAESPAGEPPLNRH